MSFDLLFCTKPRKKFKWSQMKKYMRRLPHFKGDDLTYFNEFTGVYFLFEMEDVDEFDHDQPERFTGVVCRINYGRPTFFAREALEVISDFANEFELLIDNPQSHRKPEPPDSEALFQSWVSSNRSVVRRLFRDVSPPYCPPRKAKDWWNYQRNIEKIDRLIGRKEVFVMTCALFQDPREKTRVACASSWCDSKRMPHSIVFPKCDYMLISRRWNNAGKRLTKSKNILVSYSDFLKATKNYLQPVKCDLKNVFFLSNTHKAVRDLFYQFSGKPINSIQYSPESIVDYLL